MKVTKRISVLIALLLVVSLAVVAFTVNAADAPEGDTAPAFEEGTVVEVENNYVIGTNGYSAFLSARNSVNAGMNDYRFVIAANLATFETTQNATLMLSFAKDGTTVKSFAKDVLTELDVYASAQAAGYTYIADANCLLTGVVITDIPVDSWDTVTVTLVDGSATLASGSMNITDIALKEIVGVEVPPSHINPYFEMNGGTKKALIYWFADQYGGQDLVAKAVSGEYTVALTINGVRYENVAIRGDVATGRYLVMLIEESGITGITKGVEYTCSIDIYNADGYRVIYDSEFKSTANFDA